MCALSQEELRRTCLLYRSHRSAYFHTVFGVLALSYAMMRGTRGRIDAEFVDDAYVHDVMSLLMEATSVTMYFKTGMV